MPKKSITTKQLYIQIFSFLGQSVAHCKYHQQHNAVITGCLKSPKKRTRVVYLSYLIPLFHPFM